MIPVDPIDGHLLDPSPPYFFHIPSPSKNCSAAGNTAITNAGPGVIVYSIPYTHGGITGSTVILVLNHTGTLVQTIEVDGPFMVDTAG